MPRTPHEDAVQRLEAGLLKQDRCSEIFDAAIGTSSEMGAYVRLRAAGARVAAHERWLHWVDDETYRGLNAGHSSYSPRATQIVCPIED